MIASERGVRMRLAMAVRRPAEKVEALARIYRQALQVGEPPLLDEVEMARVAEKLAVYGKQ